MSKQTFLAYNKNKKKNFLQGINDIYVKNISSSINESIREKFLKWLEEDNSIVFQAGKSCTTTSFGFYDMKEDYIGINLDVLPEDSFEEELIHVYVHEITHKLYSLYDGREYKKNYIYLFLTEGLSEYLAYEIKKELLISKPFEKESLKAIYELFIDGRCNETNLLIKGGNKNVDFNKMYSGKIGFEVYRVFYRTSCSLYYNSDTKNVFNKTKRLLIRYNKKNNISESFFYDILTK